MGDKSIETRLKKLSLDHKTKELKHEQKCSAKERYPYLSTPGITSRRNYEMEYEQKHGERERYTYASKLDITARGNYEMENEQKHGERERYTYASKPDITARGNYEFAHEQTYSAKERYPYRKMEHEQKYSEREHYPYLSKPEITARRNYGTGNSRTSNGDWLKKEIRIVLIGKTGSGKSATGNTILGKDVFLSTISGSSVTRRCSQEHADRFGRKILVVDTPGIFDTTQTNKNTQEEIERCIGISSPGPHAFILVLSITRYTEEEQNSVLHFVKHFGENIFKYFIILFTRKDDLDAEGKTLMEHIKTVPPQLRKFIEMSGGRVIAFNNRLKGEESDTQVVEMLSMILENIKSNGGECYTNEMYLEAENRLKEREEADLKAKREELEKKTKEIEKRVSEKFNEDLAKQRHEFEKRESQLRESLQKHQQEKEQSQFFANQIKELQKKLEDKKGNDEAMRQVLEHLQKSESSKAAMMDDYKKIIQGLQKEREEDRNLRENMKKEFQKEMQRMVGEMNASFRKEQEITRDRYRKEIEKAKNDSSCTLL